MTALRQKQGSGIYCSCEIGTPILHDASAEDDATRNCLTHSWRQGPQISIMYDNAGRSCWGWTAWGLAAFGVAIAVVYLLGGFDVTPAIAH
jgi:hypothetical protein